MEHLEAIKLSEFFRLFAPRYLIGTTYTASMSFFESVVLPQVDQDKLKGCVILCDQLGFTRSTEEAAALQAATRSYSVMLAPHGHSFHAKVWIMVSVSRQHISTDSL